MHAPYLCYQRSKGATNPEGQPADHRAKTKPGQRNANEASSRSLTISLVGAAAHFCSQFRCLPFRRSSYGFLGQTYTHTRTYATSRAASSHPKLPLRNLNAYGSEDADCLPSSQPSWSVDKPTCPHDAFPPFLVPFFKVLGRLVSAVLNV